MSKCHTTSGQVDIWSDLWVMLPFGQMYPLGRDIIWPSVILHWVRLTCLLEHKSGASSHSNSSSISVY